MYNKNYQISTIFEKNTIKKLKSVKHEKLSIKYNLKIYI